MKILIIDEKPYFIKIQDSKGGYIRLTKEEFYCLLNNPVVVDIRNGGKKFKFANSILTEAKQ